MSLLATILWRIRHTRIITRITLIVILLIVYYTTSLLYTHVPTSNIDTSASSKALISEYDSIRHDILRRKKYHPVNAARSIRASPTFPNGEVAFDDRVDVYVNRLKLFSDEYFVNAPEKTREWIRKMLNDLLKRATPWNNGFPRIVTSTSPTGMKGIDESFRLWERLLSLPLSQSLRVHLEGMEDGVMDAVASREGWVVDVLDDDQMDLLVSGWLGEVCNRGVVREGKWSRMWGILPFGVLRSDVFRYVNLLVRGGIYADTDTSPIAHPYLWGIEAVSILDPRLEVITNHKRNTLSPFTNAPPDNSSDKPALPLRDRYPPRLPRPSTTGVNSILDPSVSMVIALEWDSHIGLDIRRILQWTPFRLRRSWGNFGYARSLQVSQFLMMSKPYHPVMLDTLATIAELVEQGDMQTRGVLDLTGPGPFTDAVFRYLLVQYGVTPDDLRSLRHSVRIGDVIVLHEESFMTPDKIFSSFQKRVDSILDGSTSQGESADVWKWGLGYWSWRSGGRVVARHASYGSVSNPDDTADLISGEIKGGNTSSGGNLDHYAEEYKGSILEE